MMVSCLFPCSDSTIFSRDLIYLSSFGIVSRAFIEKSQNVPFRRPYD